MFLLFIRSSVLALLISVSPAAEAGGGASCYQGISAELIRELWSHTRQLIDRLPKEEKVSRRLLPKFCTSCPERVTGWAELQQVIDVYQRSVFSVDAVKKLLPLHYNDLLYRLQHTLQHCVSSSKPPPPTSKRLKPVRKLQKKLKKKSRERALQAVREFTFVIRWIDELAQHHVL